MNAPSERLVVFVTPAQKRVLAARAARMGISLSELVRRAVLAFDDTGQEVRAAGLVDRLGAASAARGEDMLRRLAQARPDDHARTRAVSNEGSAPSSASDALANEPAAPPVAAAVARALAQQAQAPSEEPADLETQALVARVLAHEAPADAAQPDRAAGGVPAIAARSI
jgi:ParB-like chromosome segregation protein Spo0J